MFDQVKPLFFLFMLVLALCMICLELENVVFQTLDIVAENPDKFRVVGLAAGSNVTLLVDQVFCEPDLSLQDNNPSRSTHLICEGLELMCFSFIL